MQGWLRKKRDNTKMQMLTVALVLLSLAEIVTAQTCIPAGSTRGCRIAAPVGDPNRCCDGATCNQALKCVADGPAVPPAPPVPPPACIPAGSTRGCRIAAPVGDPNRCCDGATCNLALKCVASGPVAPPALPPGTTGCIAAGTNRGCRFGDPAGDPNRCCSGAYCNNALRCLTCQSTGNPVACSPTAQDTTRCCNGLTCFLGVCFPQCSVTGGQCAANADCCGALECNLGTCRVPCTDAGLGERCFLRVCCPPLVCDNDPVSPVCQRPPP